MFDRLSLDRAVAYSIAVRLWQLAAGPVSLVLIAVYFSPEEQGFYYAFANLMALQGFVELGLNVVVLNLTSGQWAKLHLDEHGRAAGDADAKARLGNLLRQLRRWYSVVSVLFFLGVATAGYFFLLPRDNPETTWRLPWFALTLLTAGLTWTWPLVAMLEGCDQVATVNRYRLTQAVLGSAAVWAVMLSGGGLWAAPASAAVRLACDAHLIVRRFGRLFFSLLRTPPQPRLDWNRHVWPLQWRLGLIVTFQFFELSLPTLVIFAYHGADVGGQMGMTWTLATTLHAAALAWVQTKAPRFGALVAQAKFAELDRLFRRLTWTAIAAAIVGAAAIGALVFGLDHFDFQLLGRRLADRVLPLPEVALLLAVFVLKVPPFCMAFYIRAHRKEPLLLVSLASSVVSGLLVWLGGWHYGPAGAATGLLISTLAINLPGHYFVWRQFAKH